VNPFDRPLALHHAYATQIELDVVRSFTRISWLPPGLTRADALDQLRHLLHAFFSSHSDLHYYQGFNDVCTVLLRVMGPTPMVLAMTEHLAYLYFRDAMHTSMDPVLRQLQLVYPLIAAHDPELAAILRRQADVPVFALSWVLTWCSHDCNDLEVVCRLFDVFLCGSPLLPIYLVAAVLIKMRRQTIVDLKNDPDVLHQTLKRFPVFENTIALAAILEFMWTLYDLYPPSFLQRGVYCLSRWSCVNRYGDTLAWMDQPDEDWRMRVQEDMRRMDGDKQLTTVSRMRRLRFAVYAVSSTLMTAAAWYTLTQQSSDLWTPEHLIRVILHSLGLE
jgi:hypothetical protein